MIETINKLCEALKSSGFPVMFLLVTHASLPFITHMREDDSVPGDNFPRIMI